MARWLKEPLLHFMLLGALIFIAYGQLSGDGAREGEIVVSRGQQDNLSHGFTRTWQRAPTAEEFKGLLDNYVREEIAYRAGVAAGMDRDDTVIRQRVQQKLELLAEDVATLAVPTDDQLQDFLATHPENFQVEPQLSLRHVYFSRDRRGDAVLADASALLQRIGSAGPEGQFEQFGDPLPLPFHFVNMRTGELAQLFGTVFTEGLAGLETGRWAGPVESGFGLHLVYIEQRTEGRVAALDEVREAVQREWFGQRRREALDGLYERLAQDYTIRIESRDDPVTQRAP